MESHPVAPFYVGVPFLGDGDGMPRIAKPLRALAVKNLKAEGLHLSINRQGASSWILRAKIGLRRSDIGLGGYPAVSLALAHEKATATKESIQQGLDPVAACQHIRSVVD